MRQTRQDKTSKVKDRRGNEDKLMMSQKSGRELTVSEPLAASKGARHAANQAPPPGVPPLAQRGDEGSERWKRLLRSSPQTLVQGDGITTPTQCRIHKYN